MSEPLFTAAERDRLLYEARTWRLSVEDVDTLLDSIAPDNDAPDLAAETEVKRRTDRERKRAKMQAAGATPRKLTKGYK